MKNTFTILVLLLSIGTSSANFRQNHSVLNLKLTGRGEFTVMLDDVQYRWADNFLEVPGLFPGYHRLRVVETIHFQGRGGRGVNKRVIYNGGLNIPASSVVYASVNPRQMLVVESIQPIRVPLDNRRQGGGSDWYDDRNRGDRDFDRDRHPDRRFDPRNQDFQRRDAAQFGALRQAVSRASFDSDKQVIAMQFVRNNGIYADEVADLMKLMSFESTRLEFAKNAYAFCRDPQNYFLVNESFTFSSSIHQLQRFIGK